MNNSVHVHHICFCSNYHNWLKCNSCILYDKQPKGKCSSRPSWKESQQRSLVSQSAARLSTRIPARIVCENIFAAVTWDRVLYSRCHLGTVQRCWKADHSKHRSAKSSQKLQRSSEPKEEGGPCGFGGCWGLKHPASNPDTLSPPIRTPSKGERGGKNKTRNPVRAYLVTVWQAVITCMANSKI